ncbi:MAG: site-specific DNA-methyltransferase [Candidatus Bathyarchaeia archaeon]|jgi:site-specific DNA-methyltransferase (adenine-specific)
MSNFKIINADVLEGLKQIPSESIDCVFTSPPYWGLRDYGCEGQLGLERTFQEYTTKLVNVFDEVKRVLKPTGTCFVNLGDTYYSVSGGKFLNDNISDSSKNIESGVSSANALKSGNELEQKNLCNIPARFSIAMQEHGWILRNNIIWHKPSCMPSSVKDRFTVDFENVFFFVKSKKYYFEQQLEPLVTPYEDLIKDTRGMGGANVKENSMEKNHEGKKSFGQTINPLGRNMRAVWSINPEPYREAHFACYPTELVRRGLKAGCPKRTIDTNSPTAKWIAGTVLDSFVGSGTTLYVAQELGLNGIGIELNPKYIPLMKKRLRGDANQTALTENIKITEQSEKQD